MPKTEELQINMGPQHPSTHGVLRVVLKLDGEWITDADPDLGYLHRSFEKLGELRTYVNYLPLTDRWDYLSAMNNNLVYVMAIERLMDLEIPERAQWLRMIISELQRIASHLVFVGTFGLDVGASTPFLYCFRDREKILDLFEEFCGARLTYTCMRIGGMCGDTPEAWVERVEKFCDYLPPMLDEMDALLTGNEIFIRRTKGIGILPKDVAISYGSSGPFLRGSGIKWDLRRAQPYLRYPEIDFDIPVGEQGDCFDRYYVRFQEMRESLRIVRQCLAKLPEGDIQAKLPKTIKPPPGETYTCIESPRGELGLYLISDGSETPYRMKIRGPGFVNLSAFPVIAKGWKVADVVAILGSVDIVMGEVDR